MIWNKSPGCYLHGSVHFTIVHRNAELNILAEENDAGFLRQAAWNRPAGVQNIKRIVSYSLYFRMYSAYLICFFYSSKRLQNEDLAGIYVIPSFENSFRKYTVVAT